MGYNGITVLVVEDETLGRMNIVLALEDEGFAVHQAAVADEAIEVLNTHLEIRLMFTDIDMPGSMDGLMLAAAVRDRWPPITIIVTSGHRHVNAELFPVQGRFLANLYNTSIVIGAMRNMRALGCRLRRPQCRTMGFQGRTNGGPEQAFAKFGQQSGKCAPDYKAPTAEIQST